LASEAHLCRAGILPLVLRAWRGAAKRNRRAVEELFLCLQTKYAARRSTLRAGERVSRRLAVSGRLASAATWAPRGISARIFGYLSSRSYTIGVSVLARGGRARMWRRAE